MKTELEIRNKIQKITKNHQHVLDGGLATVTINAPRALLQIEAITSLNRLYWVLGEKRPLFEYDTKQHDT